MNNNKSNHSFVRTNSRKKINTTSTGMDVQDDGAQDNGHDTNTINDKTDAPQQQHTKIKKSTSMVGIQASQRLYIDGMDHILERERIANLLTQDCSFSPKINRNYNNENDDFNDESKKNKTVDERLFKEAEQRRKKFYKRQQEELDRELIRKGKAPSGCPR